MRIYLDNNVIIRPFDDQRQARVWLETLSFSLVLSMVESGEAEMVVSAAHRIENRVAPDPFRKKWVDRVLKMALIKAPATENVRGRAKELEAGGLKAMDALHVSSAEAAETNYFLTCDDGLRKRYIGSLSVMSPPEFISALG